MTKPLRVAPLFETLDDLDHSESAMEQLLSNKWCGAVYGSIPLPAPSVEVMLDVHVTGARCFHRRGQCNHSPCAFV